MIIIACTEYTLTDARRTSQVYVQQRSNTCSAVRGFQQKVRDTINFSERAFSPVAPDAWNSLPPDIHTAASFAVFKKLLKTHFLTQTFVT